MTYFLTFNCYGAWVPGDERGWVERARSNYRGGYKDPSPALARYARKIMPQEPYQLDVTRARIVLDAVSEACQYRGWELVAAHVRTTHVHIVVANLSDPDRAISDFKSYSSRALNWHGFETADRKRWARGGSTRRLPTAEAIRSAIQYVVDSQGDPMAVFQEQVSPR
jgi:REP element-mobilizing transposase RayT